VKVGDLVMVGPMHVPYHKPFVSIIMAVCLPEEHRNGMHLIQVLEKGQTKWYPGTYVEPINETG